MMSTTQAELPKDLFNPERLPQRDVDGFLTHPDAELIYQLIDADDEGEAAFKFIKGLGYSHAVIDIGFDAADDVSERYFASGEADCSYWVPSTPDGEGWLLAWICDTDDGPVAVYFRKDDSHD